MKKKNATTPNLIERERKGGALSTIILLVIKADDHSITKIIGIILISEQLSNFVNYKNNLSWFFILIS